MEGFHTQGGVAADHLRAQHLASGTAALFIAALLFLNRCIPFAAIFSIL